MSTCLSRLLISQAPLPLPWPADAALEEELRRLHERGQQAHPGLRLGAEPLVEHLAGLLCADDLPHQPAVYLGKLHAGDLFLTAACSSDVPGATEVLDAMLRGLVPQALGRLRQDLTFHDEVRQQTIERLLLGGAQTEPAIRTYRGQGSLRSWLGVMALRIGLNLIRQRGGESPSEDPTAHLERAMQVDHEPELTALRRRYATQFSQALREAAAQLGRDDRLLMDQYHRQGQRLEQIAHRLGVNHTTVMRRLARARALMLSATKASLGRQLGIDSQEFRELLPLVYSGIDVSMSGMFGQNG